MADASSRREPGPLRPATSASEAEARPARTLGRGLEELSPLFLSRRRAEAPASAPAEAARPPAPAPVAQPAAAPPPAQPVAAAAAPSVTPPAPAALTPSAPRLVPAAPAALPTGPRARESARRRSGTLLLRPAAGLTREQVVATIEASPSALEARLRTLDCGVEGSQGGPIDVLAIDDAGRLVVVDVDLSATGSLLVRGLDHAEWISRNLAVVLKMYGDHPIDFAARPRLVLVAHDFSRALRNAIRQIDSPEVTCVRCHGLDVSGWTGLFFERIAGDDF